MKITEMVGILHIYSSTHTRNLINQIKGMNHALLSIYIRDG